MVPVKRKVQPGQSRIAGHTRGTPAGSTVRGRRDSGGFPCRVPPSRGDQLGGAIPARTGAAGREGPRRAATGGPRGAVPPGALLTGPGGA